MRRRAPDVPAGPQGLFSEFDRLRTILQEHGKYIILLFPEYTPHDHTRHCDQLFALADRLFALPLYTRLGPVELVLLAFGLYAHDWGMAVSEAEKQCLIAATGGKGFALLPDEPSCAQAFIHEADLAGISREVAWRDYVRRTHGLRSGARLRKYLEPLGSVFAEAVAKIAEGHTLDLREVRDPDRYPRDLSVFGETVNIAALTTYVRMIDLLDIGEDRTPYALWTFVSPADPISSIEWRKHRALSPVSVKRGPALRQVLVGGHTDDPVVYAALADLKAWIDEQFAVCVALLRTISGKYDLDLDSRIVWNINSSGFEPLSVRFELDRSEVLGLFSRELYQDDPLAFIRELLQNSVDAIDMREALLAKHGLTFKGEIQVRLTSGASGLFIEWQDNGIGMDEDVLSAYFARLGCSWYRSRDANRLGKIDAISQFGIGILSCFAVSHKLAVETLRDPQAGGSRRGLSVEIPACQSHFRIRTAANIPVGTTIRLEVPPPLTSAVSKEAVCTALARIGRYVRHKITVNADGVLAEAGFIGRQDSPGTEAPSDVDMQIKIVGMRGDSAEKLRAMATTVAFEIGDLNGDYHGHYSAIIPKRPYEARASVDRSVWLLGSERIELDDVVIDTERTLFVKGIQTGSVTVGRRARVVEDLPVAGYAASWMYPRLLLNVRRPSLLEFNLSRSSVRPKSRAWLQAAWREVAGKLRMSVFDWPITNAGDMAILLGSCAVFGGVPDYGLEALVEKNETPVLVIHSGQGPVWRTLREFAHGDELVEAPFELAYANAGHTGGEFLQLGSSSDLDGWEGDDVLFPLEGFSSYRQPWLNGVLAFGYRALTELGWCPVEILMARPPTNQTVPIVCRVWRKSGGSHCADDPIKEGPRKEWGAVERWKALKGLYDAAPEVLRFPGSLGQYAAIGSRYWNINHPKIAGIVAALIELKGRMRQQRLSADRVRMVSYVASSTFYGYVVPSRISGARLAIEVPNRLLDVAEEEGLIHAEHLVPSDFFPGTVEGYQNPYYYDVGGWKHRGTGLGRRWDEAGEH